MTILLAWLARLILVAGNTGSGKTTFLISLLFQLLVAGCRVWATEPYKRTLRHLRSVAHRIGSEVIVLRAQDWQVNLLEPWTGDPRDHLAMIIDLLVRVLGLPPRSRTIILQGSHALYEQFGVWDGREDAFPTLYDLYEWVWGRPDLNLPAREAILDRLGAFLAALTPACGAYRVGWNPVDLARYSIVHELAGTAPSVAHILLEAALSAVMRHEVVHTAPNARIRLFLALDDGQRYLDGQPLTGDIQPLDELAGVIRGQGVGLGVLVQTTSGVSDRLMANLAIKVFGRLGLHTDWSRLAAEMGLDRSQLAWAQRQTQPGVFVGQVAEGWREPFLFRAPRIDLPPVVSDAEVTMSVQTLDQLHTLRADEYAGWQPAHLRSVSFSNSQRTAAGTPDSPDQGVSVATPSRSVTKEELDYLQSIAESPLVSVTERDRNLGIGAAKGHRIRDSLIKQGLVCVVPVNPGGRGRRFQLLDFTDAGRELLGTFGVSQPRGHGRGGIAHQWWCQTIADWLSGVGLKASIEDDRYGVRVDIVTTTSDGRLLAIEVETSPGHEAENIRKDLSAGFMIVVSLVKDQATVPRVQTQINSDSDASRVCVGCLHDHPRILGTVIRPAS